MKKALLVLSLVLLFSSVVIGQEFHTANQTTVAWDAVTTNTSGDPVDPAEVSYKVYLTNATTDPEKTNPAALGTTSDTNYTVTLNTEGRFFVGVSSVRTVNGEVMSESDISWSDVAAPAFGIRYYLPLNMPGGVRIQ